jgi:hypothetical protein
MLNKKYFQYYQAEKLPFSFYIEKLKEHFYKVVLPIGDPIIQNKSNFGGWSVFSRNGDWKDGYEQARKIIMEKEKLSDTMIQFLRNYLYDKDKFIKPTQICTGYLYEVIKKIENLGFQPKRARIKVLGPNGYTGVHRDQPNDLYAARIHIPIVTYPECLHIIWDENGKEYKNHLKADGSAYMIWVNNLHQAINPTNKFRYHLVMGATDTKHITQNFKYI